MEVEAYNVVGAIIFFAYIVAALLFTGLIVRDLFSLYSASHDVKRSKTRSLVDVAKRRDCGQIFVGLSVISFSVLSYHMLSFLAQSYSRWAGCHRVPSPIRLLGERGVFDFHGQQTSLHLWQWSTQSTLFQTFAETIVNDPLRIWWTQQALLYSLGWNIFMAVEGTRYQVPHLWAYYVLDQILPISFAQNLFCAATYLSQNMPQAAKLRPAAKWAQLTVVGSYLFSLKTAPLTVGTSRFLIALFGIRALLFVPQLRPKPRRLSDPVSGSMADLYWGYRYSGLLLAVGGIFLHFQHTQAVSSIVDAVRAINDDPSVSALGYDYLIAVVSLIVFVGLKNTPN